MTFSTSESIKTTLDAKVGFAQKRSLKVLGVPTNNARSRVETQIKLCIQLIDRNGNKDDLSCSHIRLPDSLISREKSKKQTKQEMGMEITSVLNLEAILVCASDINRPIQTCDGCIQRERKRSKKRDSAIINDGNKNKSVQSLDEAELLELDRARILTFNCPEFLDFSNGDTFIPTRITCYSRHHQEKIGFCIYFLLRDQNSEIVATGISPPILITDDHKSTKSIKTSPNSNLNIKTSKVPLQEPLQTPLFHQTIQPQFQNQQETSSFDFPQTPFDFQQQQHYLPLHNFQQPTGMEATFFSGWKPPITPFPNTNIFSTDIQLDILINQTTSFAILNSPTPKEPTLKRLRHQSLSEDSTDIDNLLNIPPLTPPISLITSPPPSPSPPSILKIVPFEGPVSGGTEVTILGSGFRECQVWFNGNMAEKCVVWNDNTLCCIAPPGVVGGCVVSCGGGGKTGVFVYKDGTERALLELALQVIGVRLNGRLEGAREVALKIVGESPFNTILNGNGNSNQTATTQNQSAMLENRIVKVLRMVIFESSDRVDSKLMDLRNAEGLGLFGLACIAGWKLLVEEIVKFNEVDLNSRDSNGFTGLCHALMGNHFEIVEILLKAGADKSLKSFGGRDLDHFSRLSKNTEIWDILKTGKSFKSELIPSTYQTKVANKNLGTTAFNDMAENLVNIWNRKLAQFIQDPPLQLPPMPQFLQQFPNVGFPQFPNVGFPQFPYVGFPQFPNVGFPQFPDVGFPQFPDVRFPQFPDVGFPQFPNVGFPEFPNVGFLQLPNVGFPQFPNVAFPQIPTIAVFLTDGFITQYHLVQPPPQQLEPQQIDPQLPQTPATTTPDPSSPTIESDTIDNEPRMPNPFHRFFNIIRPSASNSRVCDCRVCGRCREKISLQRLKRLTIKKKEKAGGPDFLNVSYWFSILAGLVVVGVFHYLITRFEIEEVVGQFVNVGELRHYFSMAGIGHLMPGVPGR